MKKFRPVFFVFCIFATSAVFLSCAGQQLDLSGGDASVGESVYVSNCLTCHGASGQGDTASRIIGVESNELIDAVRQGPGDMPTFSKTDISDSQLADLFAYLESL